MKRVNSTGCTAIGFIAIITLLWAFDLNAQHLRPLAGNAPIWLLNEQEARLLPPPASRYSSTAKTDDCELPVSGATVVLAGDTLRQLITADTSGRGPLVFQCINCATAANGQAIFAGNQLTYIPNLSVTAGIDQLGVSICSANTGVCFDTLYYDLLARRRDRHYFPAEQIVAPESLTQLSINTTVLPGQLRCNEFVDCPDNYAGRDQLVYFSDYSGPDETLIYRASRFGGIDSVCVRICDDYGICDTYHYAFRINRSSRGLPFMDDFSGTSPLPDGNMWLDREAYINTSFGIQPPSVGVATLDGVDQRGRPWGGNPGQADRLTSTYLNLQGVLGTPVLTFWFQRGGLGDRPEISDSLLVQFILPNGQWVTVRSFAGLPGSTPVTVVDSFQFVSVPLTSIFQHAFFQFRFVNIADRQGMRDIWNIDYVRLDLQLTQRTISDVAFTRLPNPIIAPYTSMPWRHFKADPASLLREELEVGLFNHADQTLNASPSAVQLLELNSNLQPFAPVTLFNAQESNIPNGSWINRSYSLLGDPTFPSVWASFLSGMNNTAYNAYDELRFRLRYSLNNTSQVGGPGLESVSRNDLVERTTVFSDFFAYDDGTAEAALENGPGRQIAQRYTAAVADTLQGIQLHFPYTGGNYAQQDMRLRVWIGQLDGSPEYELRLTPDYTDVYFDTLHGFTSYPLLDAAGQPTSLPLPAGDFYIGWLQASNCALGSCIAVGYDRNNPVSADNVFANNGLGWVPVSGVLPGALMIRPVVGSEPPLPTADETPAAEQPLLVYPNPATANLYVQLPAEDDRHSWSYRFFNTKGQLLTQGELLQAIPLTGLPAGMYILELTHPLRQQPYRQRVVVY